MKNGRHRFPEPEARILTSLVWSNSLNEQHYKGKETGSLRLFYNYTKRSFNYFNYYRFMFWLTGVFADFEVAEWTKQAHFPLQSRFNRRKHDRADDLEVGARLGGCMRSDTWLTHLVQHHIADGWEPLGLLYAGGHELEAQQEVSVVLALSTGLRQVCGSKKRFRHEERRTETGEL